MAKNHNKQPKGKSGEILLRTAVGGILAATALAGCSGNTEAKPQPTVTVTKTIETSSPEEQRANEAGVGAESEAQAQEQMDSYIASPERVKTINKFIDSAGEVIVHKYQNGEDVFDGYYPGIDSDKPDKTWLSKNGAPEGWVWLQHSPDYGGSNTQMSASVYMGSDGQIDLSKGTLAVYIREIGPNNTTIVSASLEKAGEFGIVSKGEMPAEYETGPTTEYAQGDEYSAVDVGRSPGYSYKNGSYIRNMPGDVAQARDFDQKAVNAVADFLDIERAKIPEYGN